LATNDFFVAAYLFLTIFLFHVEHRYGFTAVLFVRNMHLDAARRAAAAPRGRCAAIPRRWAV